MGGASGGVDSLNTQTQNTHQTQTHTRQTTVTVRLHTTSVCSCVLCLRLRLRLEGCFQTYLLTMPAICSHRSFLFLMSQNRAGCSKFKTIFLCPNVFSPKKLFQHVLGKYKMLLSQNVTNVHAAL